MLIRKKQVGETLNDLINKIEKENEKPILSKEPSIKKEEKKEEFIPEPEEEKVELFRCPICNQEFSTQKGLRIHEKKKHKNENVVETKEEKKEEYVEPEYREKLECPFCMKKYKKPIWLDKHIEEKHGNEEYNEP